MPVRLQCVVQVGARELVIHSALARRLREVLRHNTTDARYTVGERERERERESSGAHVWQPEGHGHEVRGHWITRRPGYHAGLWSIKQTVPSGRT
jgi:hypothetical protein